MNPTTGQKDTQFVLRQFVPVLVSQRFRISYSIALRQAERKSSVVVLLALFSACRVVFMALSFSSPQFFQILNQFLIRSFSKSCNQKEASISIFHLVSSAANITVNVTIHFSNSKLRKNCFKNFSSCLFGHIPHIATTFLPFQRKHRKLFQLALFLEYYWKIKLVEIRNQYCTVIFQACFLQNARGKVRIKMASMKYSSKEKLISCLLYLTSYFRMKYMDCH